MKYRKKPVVVEAMRWEGERHYGVPGVCKCGGLRPHVHTAHGQSVYLESGDWIIEEPDGRGYYPCKPDIFAATYELVSE